MTEFLTDLAGRGVDIALLGLGAIAIVLIGRFIAKLVSKGITAAGSQIALQLPKSLTKKMPADQIIGYMAKAAKFAVLYITYTAALRHIGFDMSIIDNTISAVLAAIPLAIAIDYGVNGLKTTKSYAKKLTK